MPGHEIKVSLQELQMDIGGDVEMALDEYIAAVNKHPKFCDKFTAHTIIHARHEERLAKKKNSEPPYYADKILLEEVAEARTAWLQGDKAHCRQELAQCIAVCLRMMQLCK